MQFGVCRANMRRASAAWHGPTRSSEVGGVQEGLLPRRTTLLIYCTLLCTYACQVEAIKEIYYRISPDVDQSTFFRHKGWDYDRSATLEREQRSPQKVNADSTANTPQPLNRELRAGGAPPRSREAPEPETE